MLHINEIELYKEPLTIALEKGYLIYHDTEMSYFDVYFLCGLLRKVKPHNIAEIGVARGGTTGIMIQCLEMLEVDDYFIHSVDYYPLYYKDNSLGTGYLTESFLERFNARNKHRLYLGDVAYTALKDLNEEIDFLVLDTMHLLPGEILDALCLIPKMKNGSYVVLHDLAIFHKTVNEGFATAALFAAVTADKYINYDKDRPQSYPNIGAFVVDKDTKDNLYNLLLALILPWRNKLDEKQKDHYMAAIKELYGDEYAQLFEKMLLLNQKD